QCGGAQLTPNAEPVACVLSADDHQRPPRCQRPPELGERAVASDIDNDVLSVATVSEIPLGVIDYVVCTDRAHQLGLRSTPNPSHLGPVRLRNLHSERTDAPAR